MGHIISLKVFPTTGEVLPPPLSQQTVPFPFTSTPMGEVARGLLETDFWQLGSEFLESSGCAAHKIGIKPPFPKKSLRFVPQKSYVA